MTSLILFLIALGFAIGAFFMAKEELVDPNDISSEQDCVLTKMSDSCKNRPDCCPIWSDAYKVCRQGTLTLNNGGATCSAILKNSIILLSISGLFAFLSFLALFVGGNDKKTETKSESSSGTSLGTS